MQDNYIGDIGDYGKYGFLREICANSLSLSVNWYQVIPTKNGKQKDGKYTNYLLKPQQYREYDPTLFDSLHKIIMVEKDRRIARIEQENLFPAIFFSVELNNDRTTWHKKALTQTKDTDIIFLDPDNGLETDSMHRHNRAKNKHVKWNELKDYYTRGQSVILYQHRPQMTKKEKCIENIMLFQKNYLMADSVKLLEFPKYTNRFYFIFLHEKHKAVFEKICNTMTEKWKKDNFCYEIKVKE
jgi:hypothetical protein